MNNSLNTNSLMNSLQSRLGIHSVNVGGSLTNATNGAISILITVMDWIFLAAELGIMIGALVFLVGALETNRWPNHYVCDRWVSRRYDRSRCHYGYQSFLSRIGEDRLETIS